MYSDATGRPLAGGATLLHPGLDKALRLLRDEGAAAFYSGPIAEAMVMAIGDQGDLGPADLAAYEVQETEPQNRALRGVTRCRRAATTSTICSGTLHGLELHDDPAALAIDLVRRAASATPVEATPRALRSSMATETRARSRPASGLSSGVWLADLGIHLNSMLGEGELVRGRRGSRHGGWAR